MIVAFDNTFLTLVLNPNAKPTPDPATQQPVPHCRQRVEALVDRYSKAGDQVIIPTPCLAEILQIVPDLTKAVDYIERVPCFQPFAFDVRAAIELAELNRKASKNWKKRNIGKLTKDSKQKVKFDRQIVSIALVNGASILHTDDPGQTTFAQAAGLNVVHTWDLDLPPEYAQTSIFDEREG